MRLWRWLLDRAAVAAAYASLFAISDVLAGRSMWAVEAGDNLTHMRSLPDACVDAAVLDPPAGISFMGRAWDADHGGGAQWRAYMAERFREMLRVSKPGAHALVWALPRTAHWTTQALEDAGWEIRDRKTDLVAADVGLQRLVDSLDDERLEALARIIEGQESAVLLHLFGQGFPKSLSVDKALDKAAGAVRAVRAVGGAGTHLIGPTGLNRSEVTESDPATELARIFAGYGTALKPAVEFWIVARKPLVGTVAANAAEHGAGALNIDGCRVGTSGGTTGAGAGPTVSAYGLNGRRGAPIDAGRWPPNLMLEHAPGCRVVGTRSIKTGDGWNTPAGRAYRAQMAVGYATAAAGAS
jgi:hypothetical protein